MSPWVQGYWNLREEGLGLGWMTMSLKKKKGILLLAITWMKLETFVK